MFVKPARMNYKRCMMLSYHPVRFSLCKSRMRDNRKWEDQIASFPFLLLLSQPSEGGRQQKQQRKHDSQTYEMSQTAIFQGRLKRGRRIVLNQFRQPFFLIQHQSVRVVITTITDHPKSNKVLCNPYLADKQVRWVKNFPFVISMTPSVLIFSQTWRYHHSDHLQPMTVWQFSGEYAIHLNPSNHSNLKKDAH